MKLLREYIRALLDQDHAQGDPWEQIFQQIRDNRLHGAPLPDINYDALADAMNKDLGYDVDREAFSPTSYATFEDWFLRELSGYTRAQCEKKSVLADVCSPVQGTVRKNVPVGEMTLKKSVVDVDQLLGLLQGEELVQISLQKTDCFQALSQWQ